MAQDAGVPEDYLGALWRAVAVFRVAAQAYSALTVIQNFPGYRHPVGGWMIVLDAVKAGATGYLLKSAAAAEFRDALDRTALGEPVFTPGLAGLVLGEYRRLAAERAVPSAETPQLTQRETEVLRLVASGLSYKQIAQRLSLPHRTVQNHVQNTLNRLQLHNRVELARYAIREGLGDDVEA